MRATCTAQHPRASRTLDFRTTTKNQLSQTYRAPQLKQQQQQQQQHGPYTPA